MLLLGIYSICFQILGGSCKSNLDGIDISTLSQKPLLNLLHISDLHSK